MLILDKGKIRCAMCKKNYRSKMERKKQVFCCSGYMNYGRDFCSYRPVSAEDLMLTITKHFAVLGRQIENDVNEHVKRIDVKENGFEITYYDNKKSIVDMSDNYGIKVKY